MAKGLILLALLLLVSGCTPGSRAATPAGLVATGPATDVVLAPPALPSRASPNPTSSPSPLPAPTATPNPDRGAGTPPAVATPARLAGGGSLTVEDGLLIKTTGSLNLAATFYAPANTAPPWPGVVLVHMANGRRRDWSNFAARLAETGYAVLAFDLRGHGQTGGEIDWQKARGDIRNAWQFFAGRPDIDSARTALIGASVGANLALSAAAAEPSVRTVVLLSPGINYYNLSAHPALEKYGERPVLILASRADSYAAESSERLASLAAGEVRLMMYPDAGHGLAILKREAGAAGLILEWLDRFLR